VKRGDERGLPRNFAHCELGRSRKNSPAPRRRQTSRLGSFSARARSLAQPHVSVVELLDFRRQARRSPSQLIPHGSSRAFQPGPSARPGLGCGPTFRPLPWAVAPLIIQSIASAPSAGTDPPWPVSAAVEAACPWRRDLHDRVDLAPPLPRAFFQAASPATSENFPSPNGKQYGAVHADRVH